MAVTENNITICGHGSGTPSLKNMNTYLTTRYNSKASNGVRKGIVKVMRLKALTDDNRKRFQTTYGTLLGRNSYSQSLRQYVYTPNKGRYYSDCSSSGMATFNKLGYKVALLNTAGIYQSSLFEEVKVKIKNGHITNPEILKVGDCLLFKGSDPSRPLQIGHVEFVYQINGTSSSKTTSTLQKESSSFKVGQKIEVTATELNVRKTPNGSVLNRMKKGHKCTLRAIEGTWGKVCVIINGKTVTGWISLKYAKRV